MSFGTMLRAFRLGYRKPKGRDFVMRLSDNADGSFNVSLVPLNMHVPKHKPREHRCWWEGENGGNDIINLLPDVRNLKTVKKIIEFDVDEHGNRVTA